MLAQEMNSEIVASSGWFLDHAWVIPIIPAVAFVLIIFFGKKLPMKGSELGVFSMLASLVFAGGAAWQWIQRVNSVVDVAHDAVKEGAYHAAPYVEPVIREWTWWQSGGFHFGIGQHIDGLALTLLVVVASFQVSSRSTHSNTCVAIVATPTSLLHSLCSRPACCAWFWLPTWCS